MRQFNPNTLPCSWRGKMLDNVVAFNCPRCPVHQCDHPDINRPTTPNKWREDQAEIASCIRCPLRDGPPIPIREKVALRPRTPPEERGGPGTEMVKLLKENGADAAWCEGCKGRALAMDAWGVKGCQERRAEIVDWLKTAAAEKSWLEKAGVAWSLSQHPWFDPLDPFGCLVDEAIRRALDRQQEHQQDSAAATDERATADESDQR
jgi:hypothetical protein